MADLCTQPPFAPPPSCPYAAVGIYRHAPGTVAAVGSRSQQYLAHRSGCLVSSADLLSFKFRRTGTRAQTRRVHTRLPTRGSLHENVLSRPRKEHAHSGGYASLDVLLESKTEESTALTGQHEHSNDLNHRIEEFIERIIFDCRFLTLMAVAGSLAGSILCFLKGSLFVFESFVEYFHASWQGLGTGQVILLLVEAVDVYLMGTVMLIFGMGLYELFVSSIEVTGNQASRGLQRATLGGSNLFGLFRLRERPLWLEIRSLDELKTKLGHVIVMILLVGMFEKSKKVPVNSGVDLLCFSASILLSSGCLFLLSKLNPTNRFP